MFQIKPWIFARFVSGWKRVVRISHINLTSPSWGWSWQHEGWWKNPANRFCRRAIRISSSMHEDDFPQIRTKYIWPNLRENQASSHLCQEKQQFSNPKQILDMYIYIMIYIAWCVSFTWFPSWRTSTYNCMTLNFTTFCHRWEPNTSDGTSGFVVENATRRALLSLATATKFFFRGRIHWTREKLWDLSVALKVIKDVQQLSGLLWDVGRSPLTKNKTPAQHLGDFENKQALWVAGCNIQLISEKQRLGLHAGCI